MVTIQLIPTQDSGQQFSKKGGEGNSLTFHQWQRPCPLTVIVPTSMSLAQSSTSDMQLNSYELVSYTDLVSLSLGFFNPFLFLAPWKNLFQKVGF